VAASTITRDTWTNDTGSVSTPNNDGTILQNSVLQNHIYARIDAMFAGAGAYATCTFGGLVAAEGFGTHLFSAGGTGGQTFRVRNTSAGTGNFSVFELGNDATASAAALYVFSSTWTTAGRLVQDSCTLDAVRAGGLGLAASHASGIIRFYTGVGEAARLTATGQLLLGDSTNADVTSFGLTIRNTDYSHALAFKGADVAHGLGAAETDTFGFMRQYQANVGGLEVYGLAESGSATALMLTGNLGGAGSTTKSTAGQAAVMARGAESGGGAMTANANVFAIVDGIAGSTRFIFDADGDPHQDVGTVWTNFDVHDDVALLHALSAGVSRPGDPLRRRFATFLEAHRETLTRNRIVTFNRDGHHFINWSRAHMLTIGAVRQVGMQVQALERRIAALEAA
jgi:hypothetical protein